MKTKTQGLNTPIYGDNDCDVFSDCYNCTVNSCYWSPDGTLAHNGSCGIVSEDSGQIDRDRQDEANAGSIYLGLQI